ncbi:hypothetical protein AB8880_10990 [Alphaproteobacteria bacterium LSUCC0684]
MSNRLSFLRMILAGLMLAGPGTSLPVMAQNVSTSPPAEPVDRMTKPRDITATLRQDGATAPTSDEAAGNAPLVDSADNATATTAASEEDTSDTSTAETLPAPTLETSSLSSADGVGLRRQDPSSIRLAALGIDRPDQEGLGRLMWDGSEAERVNRLYELLPRHVPAISLHERLMHVMLARSVPPEGSVEMAEALVRNRLDWLKDNVTGDDLAALVRQLPMTGDWMDWQTWLVYHDLLTREDEEACTIADSQAATTLEPLWHQINAFCHVIHGEVAKASFALDILEDRGVDDPIFFALMRKLTGAGNPIDEVEGDTGLLNLVLMDSARVSIDEEMISAVDTGYQSSLGQLRYLSDGAALLHGARVFRNPQAGITDIIATWALLPPSKVPASEALTRLRLGGTPDEIDLARLYAWQATVLEQDARAAADLAYAALEIDLGHIGIRALGLWLPFIATASEDAGLAHRTGPLLGLDEAFMRDQVTIEAGAWAKLLALPDEPLDPASLILAGALDAIPLLAAVGVEVPELPWEDLLEGTPGLTGAASPLSLPRLEALKTAAAGGRKAETLMMAALALDTTPLHQLSRDDAATVAGALFEAGLEETSRDLAREILKSWAVHRHFNAMAAGKAANAS